MKEIKDVVKALGKYFDNPDCSKKVSLLGGDPLAFERYVTRMQTEWPELKDANETPLV